MAERDWQGCVRAANRLMDLVCLMYHPGDEKARRVAPTATWAGIIAEELGIVTPSQEAEQRPCEHCGTTERPREMDRFNNWLCAQCATAAAEDEWNN